MPALHYIYDPFCGWCYGAAPLVKAAELIDGIEIQLHAGGMLIGQSCQVVTPQFRAFVMQHDERIAQMSVQPFGAAYRDGLLQDATAVFDSEPPTTAILAAGTRGLKMLQRIQKAHFEEGRRVADESVLFQLGTDLGFVNFAKAFNAARGSQTARHIADSRDLLAQVGGEGFPTFVLGDHRLDHAPYLGKADAWRSHLENTLTEFAQ